MKFKVIQGEKGKNQKTENKQQAEKTAHNRIMEDYYAKERPRAQDMEKAEGDEDIIDSALEKQGKTGNAA